MQRRSKKGGGVHRTSSYLARNPSSAPPTSFRHYSAREQPRRPTLSFSKLVLRNARNARIPVWGFDVHDHRKDWRDWERRGYCGRLTLFAGSGTPMDGITTQFTTSPPTINEVSLDSDLDRLPEPGVWGRFGERCLNS